jgi:uncharacterized membrane protein YkvI
LLGTVRLIKACGLFFLAARRNQQVDSALAGCVSSLVTTVVVVVVNESLDSKEQVRAVFLQLDVNVHIFYRFSKSFYPDVVIGAAVHTRLHLRIFSTGVSPFLARKLAALVRVDYFRCSIHGNGTFEHLYAVSRFE